MGKKKTAVKALSVAVDKKGIESVTQHLKTGKNITVYVPAETAEKMDELREVNWSQICKAAIESYVEARRSVNPAVRLRLNEMKQAEEKEGYIFGSQLASEILKELSYDAVHRLRWDVLDEQFEWLWFEEPTLVTDWLDDAVDGSKLTTEEEQRKWRKKFDEAASKKNSIIWILKLAESKKGHRKNIQFFNGVIKALRELLS